MTPGPNVSYSIPTSNSARDVNREINIPNPTKKRRQKHKHRKRAEDFFYGDSSQESVQEEFRFDVPQQQQRSEDDHQSNNKNNFTMGESAPAVREVGGPVMKKRKGMKQNGRSWSKPK